MPAPNQKCHNCQSNLALPCFDNREKGYSVCSPCMEEMKRELESKGEKAKLWDNFFSYFNEQGTEHGFVCSFCIKTIQNCQEHQENGDKMIIKHKCQVECKKSIGCGKPYQLTQAYADWITKYKESIFGSNFNSKFDLTTCPNCEIKGIEKKLKEDGSWLGRKYINEKKEALKELERLTGKGNNDNQERERERERERETILTYFQQHGIKSITLQGKNLVIEYHNSPTETKTIDNQELQLIQSYCQKLGVNSLSLSDLQQAQNSQTKPSTNYLPYILGGIGILVVIIIAYFLFRNKKE